MLVAEWASPTTVFDAVTAEMERLLNADGVTLGRYEPDDEVTVVAQRIESPVGGAGRDPAALSRPVAGAGGPMSG
jgi:hypothetical protein